MTVAATSIAEFCKAHGISRATFYNLKQRGMAPKLMHVFGRRLVSTESAAWRRLMEEQAADQQTGKA